VGTLIWVSIPFEAARTQRHSALVEPPQQLAAGLRALVVEAHPASRAATLEVLRSLGVSGSAAVDVHGAFEQLVREGARSAYDVVIFAAASPHAGRESPFARRMLAAAGGGGPRLIKLVPMSTLAELDIHAGQGVHARLPKPVTQELLRNALLEMQFEGVEQRVAIESGHGGGRARGAFAQGIERVGRRVGLVARDRSARSERRTRVAGGFTRAVVRIECAVSAGRRTTRSAARRIAASPTVGLIPRSLPF
jgi:AmiR/NasT family two-component response regulator